MYAFFNAIFNAVRFLLSFVVFLLSYVLVSFDVFGWCRVFVNNRVTIVKVETKQCHAVNYKCICTSYMCSVVVVAAAATFLHGILYVSSPFIFHLNCLLVKLKTTQINTIRIVRASNCRLSRDILTKTSKLCNIFQ